MLTSARHHRPVLETGALPIELLICLVGSSVDSWFLPTVLFMTTGGQRSAVGEVCLDEATFGIPATPGKSSPYHV